MLGAIALMTGAGRADAGWPCNDQSPPQDTSASINNDTYVGIDLAPNLVGASPGDYPHGWICVAPTGGEANQSWVNWWLTPGAHPGYTATSDSCLTIVVPGCRAVLGSTGAYVNPVTGNDLPADGDSTTSASAGVGGGTCVSANGTGHCPSGVTVAGVTINEADLVPVATTITPTPPCSGVNNTCLPTGVKVAVFDDTANPTLSVHTVTGTTPVDVPRQCVQVNASC